ncbi:hypothetical protein QE152_g20008 [Popillia japonica]|uniref:Uncharacterized protein n=1 Tax=Popillia japonica TaxID=7064 RepID=A0AAW1KMA1_POPJA
MSPLDEGWWKKNYKDEIHPRLSLAQLLQAVEEDESEDAIDIYALPSEDGNDTDMGEDLSDDEHRADLSSIGPKMLKTACEVESRINAPSTAEEPTPSCFLGIQVMKNFYQNVLQRILSNKTKKG